MNIDGKYHLPSWPKTLIDRLLWNATMGDIDGRLITVEARAASFDALEAQGIQASLDYIQINVAPHVASLQTKITLAQEQIDQIIIDGKAPDALKLGGNLPAFYATAQGLLDVQSSLSGYIRTDQRGEQDGVAPLGSDSKVPLANLPTMTTTATVGAAVAGANGLATPDDGDFFAGVKSASSTMFKTTWGNIKTALTAVFDGRYLKLVGGILSGTLTVQKASSTFFAGILVHNTGAHDAAIQISAGNRGFSGNHIEVGQRNANGSAYLWVAGKQWVMDPAGNMSLPNGGIFYGTGDVYVTFSGLNTVLSTVLGRMRQARLSAEGSSNVNRSGWNVAPNGAYITGIYKDSAGEIMNYSYRYIQQTDLFGNWVTIPAS